MQINTKLKKITTLSGVLDILIIIAMILSGAILLFIMVIMVIHIFGRYFFNAPIPWAIEFSEYLLAISVFLAAAWVFKEGSHVMIDSLVNILRPKIRYRLSAITACIMAAFCLFLTYWGVMVTYQHFVSGQVVWKTVLTPLWILDIFIPISTILLFSECLRKAGGYWVSANKS